MNAVSTHSVDAILNIKYNHLLDASSVLSKRTHVYKFTVNFCANYFRLVGDPNSRKVLYLYSPGLK